MQAAVVTRFGVPPEWTAAPEPDPADGEVVLDVLAAALHPRVRSQALGDHYTSTDELPLVPGVDGVGRAADGARYYFVLDDTVHGSIAERVAVDPRRSVRLPDALTDEQIAAIAGGMNPAMSSWVALRRRVVLPADASVLVLGATGAAGALAVQVAKRIGAGTVVAAGRDAGRLASLGALGADRLVSLTGSPDEVATALAEAAADVDVVVDYLWGDVAPAAMVALITARADRGRPLTWITIGSMAGTSASVPSAALRAADLRLVGSGQGSVSTRDIVAELPALVDALAAGDLRVDVERAPFETAAERWTARGGHARTVFVA